MLDLKTDAGRAALMKLIPTADAFVHNMRQQALDKLGFTYQAVRAANPNIVYAAAVGFGRHGRYAGKPAYDDVIQAASGFAGLFQMRDGTPLYAPTIAADKISGLHLAHAVLAALLYRERSGKTPGYVEVPMFELMAAFSLTEHLSHATFEEEGKIGYVRVLSPGRRPYKTKDGWIGVLPYTERGWTKVLTEIGHPAVAKLAWFKDPTERSTRVDELYSLLAEVLPTRTTAEWLAIFERLDIPHAPVRTPQDLLTDPAPGRRRLLRDALCLGHPDQAHPAPGRERGGGRQRPRPAPAAARRRHRGRAARGRLQRGRDRTRAARPPRRPDRPCRCGCMLAVWRSEDRFATSRMRADKRVEPAVPQLVVERSEDPTSRRDCMLCWVIADARPNPQHPRSAQPLCHTAA